MEKVFIALRLNHFHLHHKLQSPQFLQIIADSLASYGGRLEFMDMCELYKMTGFEEGGIRNVNKSAVPDGQAIYLHDKEYEIGGPANRLVDALHLFGHTLAWHIPEADARRIGLTFYGTTAQGIACEDQQGASEEKLRAVETYELEAHCLMLGILAANKDRLCAELDITGNGFNSILSYFRTMCALDTHYICSFYRAPETTPSFQKFFEGNATVDASELRRLRNRIKIFEVPSSDTTQFTLLEKLPKPVIIGSSAKQPNPAHAGKQTTQVTTYPS